jgi:hypothetical protein
MHPTRLSRRAKLVVAVGRKAGAPGAELFNLGSRRDSHPLLHAHGHRFIAVMSRMVRWSPTTSRKEVNSPSARDPSPAQKVLGGK